MDRVEEIAALLPGVLDACRAAETVAVPRGARVSGPRRALLELLDPDVGTPVGTLASQAGVTQATMSTALSRLERDGFAVRERSGQDARVVLVRLTPEGEALREATSPFDHDQIEAIAAHLTHIEQGEVVQGLRLLRQAALRAGKQ